VHESRQMCVAIWNDKQPILLLSTHAPPSTPMECTVPRQNGALCSDVLTSPMLKEYTTNMRGVDVANRHFSIWRTAARFRLLKLIFVHMAEYTTYYAYTIARYLSTPNGLSPCFDEGTPSISPDMDGEASTFRSETICLK
jgi:hypothetical protein